jgi:hypothetical protein
LPHHDALLVAQLVELVLLVDSAAPHPVAKAQNRGGIETGLLREAIIDDSQRGGEREVCENLSTFMLASRASCTSCTMS